MNIFVKVRNASITLLSAVVYIFRKRTKISFDRIMIIQNAKMGDMVCTTPVFRAIKLKYPNVALSVMGNELNQELLKGNPYIDKYIIRPETLRELFTLVAEEKLNVGVLPAPDTEALFALMLASVPLISLPKIENGWSPYSTKSYRFLSFFAYSRPHRMGSYAPREYLRLLEPLGIFSEDTKKDVIVSAEAVSKIKDLLKRKGFEGKMLIGIAPSVGNKIKSWGGDKFAEVASSLAKNLDVQVVVIGGVRDTEEVKEMLEALPLENSVIDLSGKLSLEELKALIGELDLFISVDTGPIYIAEALGVPTVDIVGPMDENEQPPKGPRHRLVVPPRKAPALHIMNASIFDRAEARRQVKATTPEAVIKEAESLLRS